MAERQGKRNGMHHACAERNLGYIQLFLQYGLSLQSPKDENGETPLDILMNRTYDKTNSSSKKRAECLKALKIPDTAPPENSEEGYPVTEDAALKGAKTLLDKTPELSDAHRLINPHSCSWNKLGLALKVSFNDREEIKTSNHSNSERLESVLNKWIESKSVPVTWRRLVKALTDTNLGSVVKSIYDFLKTDEALETYGAS